MTAAPALAVGVNTALALQHRLGPTATAVLRMLPTGATNRQIGSALNCPEGTVKSAIHRLSLRLGGVDRAHLVSIAVAVGLIVIRLAPADPAGVPAQRSTPPGPPGPTTTLTRQGG